MKNIVVLDGFAANPGDLSWQGLAELGRLTVHDRTVQELVVERALNAEILLTNKTVLDAGTLAHLPKLRCVSVLATGYNIVDIEAAKQQGITVCNVRGYAANSVAQHVFALILTLSNKVSEHALHTANGGWQNSQDWSYSLHTLWELAGKTMGIYGLGQIGRRVADIALAFGMKVIAHHKHPVRDRKEGVEFVAFGELLERSDILSLHAPLTAENQGIINTGTLRKMKPNAVLVNTGRGGLLAEGDLRTALEKGWIAAACLDVLSEEPPKRGNPLLGLPNCMVTPHNAWATKEARQKLLEESVENVRAFLMGSPRNLVGQ